MKKFFVTAVAALALTFTACTEGATNEEANTLVENLQSLIESGDTSAVQSTLASAQEKIAELIIKDPEAAKTYVSKIQEFVKDNQEKIVSLIGENELTQGLVTTLVNTPVETVINTLTTGQGIIDNAQQTVENLQDSVRSSVDQAVDEKVNEVQDAVSQAVDDKINETTKKANEELNKAASEAAKKLGL